VVDGVCDACRGGEIQGGLDVLSERFTACKSASGDVRTLDSWVISKGNYDLIEREQGVAFACFA
jgi:hypothetical protein